MELTSHSVPTNHEADINDAQLDFYGRRLATCAADGKVKVFDVAGAELSHFAAHTGPAYSVSWSHPSYGLLLATGGNDHRAAIWKESSANQWSLVYEYTLHGAPVTAVAWAPWELGLVLLVGSQDGCVSVLTRVADDKWEQLTFFAHTGGVTAAAWAPAVQAASPDLRRSFASVGADSTLKVWRFRDGEYAAEPVRLAGTTLTSVAWSPAGPDRLAIGSAQGAVIVLEATEDGWARQVAWRHKEAVLGVSWNLAGRLLAASLEDGETKVLQQEGSDWVEAAAVGP